MAGSKKFLDALHLLSEEKGIDVETFLEMLREAIEKAYKKNYLNPDANVRVIINEKNGKIRLFELRTVVDDLDDEDIEISLEEAQEINANYQIGDVVETEVDVDLIGRLAAIQTKQLFRQKIRETEKEALYNEFADKKDDIMTGIVDRVEEKFAIVNIGKTGAFLASNQQIPGEKLVEGQHLKVYVSDVDRGTKGTHIVVSRVEPNLVKRLFEIEVPEVYDGTVEIKSVSREPGERTKMAVYTANENIDPIGSCVGPKGSRVKNVVDELQGEMIDIIEWSSDPVKFISHALSPSQVLSVKINEATHSASVIVPDNQLSLAIGKRGQNARLAVRLTGWKIDIKPFSEAVTLGLITLDQPVEVDEEFETEFEQAMLVTEADETVVEEVIEEVIEEVVEEVVVEEVKEEEPAITLTDIVIEPAVEEAEGEEVTDGVKLIHEEENEETEYDSKYDEEIDYDEYDEYYDAD
ncbi:transcription termination factor NusA [Tannockella kyphosi]|uniref:transcription termination factor NusA n=1 Tax=Tannockella kyphosi TaxID=2899121 RepID=UPI002010CEF8|nr:transcription termination factor NusA [Tannockella kyphosi]